MAQQQSDNNAEKWDFFLQNYHKQIRKTPKLDSWPTFMNHMRGKPTFVIVGHYACRTGILAIKTADAFPMKFLYFISMLEQYHSF